MSHRNPFRKSVGVYEVMATSYTGGSNDTRTDSRYTQGKTMDSIASSKSTDRNHPGLKESVGKSSPKGVNHVNFDTKEKHVEKREKYLTAKYGQHQMLLIKKRLAVEMWLFEELSRLYCTEDDDHDCNLELEEVLNLETDGERRAYVLQLRDTQQMDEELYGRNMAPLEVEIEGPMSEVSIIHYACNIYSYTPVNHESFDGDKEILAGKHFIQPLTAHRYEDELSSG